MERERMSREGAKGVREHPVHERPGLRRKFDADAYVRKVESALR